MGEKPHFAGHRVADLSFRRGWVKCDCDAEFRIPLHPELPVEVGHDALEAAFRAHRKAEVAKVEATTAHYKAAVDAP